MLVHERANAAGVFDSRAKPDSAERENVADVFGDRPEDMAEVFAVPENSLFDVSRLVLSPSDIVKPRFIVDSEVVERDDVPVFDGFGKGKFVCKRTAEFFADVLSVGAERRRGETKQVGPAGVYVFPVIVKKFLVGCRFRVVAFVQDDAVEVFDLRMALDPGPPRLECAERLPDIGRRQLGAVRRYESEIAIAENGAVFHRCGVEDVRPVRDV